MIAEIERCGVEAIAPSPEEFRGVVKAVRRFLLANAHRVPHNEAVTHKWLTDFIVFHAVQGTLAVCWSFGRVSGVAVAWQMQEERLRAAGQAGEDIFDWQPNDPAGDCVYLSLVISDEPGVVRTLARYFLESCPQWRELNQYAHRKGRLTCSRKLLSRLAGE